MLPQNQSEPETEQKSPCLYGVENQFYASARDVPSITIVPDFRTEDSYGELGIFVV